LPKLRVGIVNYLNSRPLALGFLKGLHADLFAPSFHSPAVVARLLAQRELDVGLIPSIELQRIPGLQVIRDLCVSAKEEVRSVILVSRGPVEKIRRVALDTSSRTSAALLRILMKDRFGLDDVEYTEHRPDLPRMLTDADAALLIGDPALKVPRDEHVIVDLAAEWRAMTGHPFVFAVWAVREGVEFSGLDFYFKSSLRLGLDSVETLSREAAAELDLDVPTVEHYLTENLGFFLRWEEICGLTEYHRRAFDHGLTPRFDPIHWWGEGGNG
jgi:chorismate dehydratase